MDNQQSIVTGPPTWSGPPPHAPWPPSPPPRSGVDGIWKTHPGWVVALASFIVTTLVAGSAALVWIFAQEVPYAITAPGSAQSTANRVSVSGHDAFPASGEVYFVTVTTDVDVTRWEKFWADRDSDVEISPRDEELQGLTPEEDLRYNQNLMSQSKDTASIVALQKLGYDVSATTTGVIIESISPGGPSEDKLPLFSVIIAVAGTPVLDADSLRDQLATHAVGDTVAVTVEEAGANRDIPVTLGENPETHKPYLGIVPSDRLAYELPFNVSIESAKVGGPSAGLAYTLEILDILTPGEITGGHRVAVTGTINIDGTVGAIGGIRQKTVAVERADIQTFLVPADHNCGQDGGSCNFSEAKAKAGDDVTVVPVATLDEALSYLSTVGGNGLALGTPGATENAGG